MFALLIGGAAALCVVIGVRSGSKNTGDPAGPISNNPVSEWNDNQPYNP
ncbi:MAG: hypothetical protein J5896_02405 [Alphaproteobacteria bacterium]|nr:hypothetical protein [Alphaproteobacteria bacterium]